MLMDFPWPRVLPSEGYEVYRVIISLNLLMNPPWPRILPWERAMKEGGVLWKVLFLYCIVLYCISTLCGGTEQKEAGISVTI